MGGFSWLARRPAAAGDPTHALFAAQSHSIVDNLVALFGHSRAWNCSNQGRALTDINGSLNAHLAGRHLPDAQKRLRATAQIPGINIVCNGGSMFTAFSAKSGDHPLNGGLPSAGQPLLEQR